MSDATTAKSAFSTPTLESLSDSQIEAIRLIPRHDESSPPAIEASQPVSIFLDEEQYALEQEKVFKKLPVVVTISAMLKENGTIMAHDGYGVPLVLMRGQDGVVRAFLNACQHKGSKLVETCEPYQARKLTCPYHAWTYALDGKLVAVPRVETFQNLDKASRKLKELPCLEKGGLVWVMLDPDATPDFSIADEGLINDFDAMELADLHVYGYKRFELKANWKLVLEPFLEGYHVQRLHAKSIGQLYADVPNVRHKLGRHIRQISGKMNYTPEILELTDENIHKTVTHAYQVFPNTVLVTSPYYISVMIIIPRGVGRSTVEYFNLTRGPADNPKAKELYERSYQLILKVFGGEDFRAAEITHEGLSSGALETVVYGGLEDTIPLYYRGLDEVLKGAG